ncbi:MAG TPA: ferrochelatase, partial [Fibrobacteria bacterium]|nr:ferrochelatase [Fibrobacteria bacterium]
MKTGVLLINLGSPDAPTAAAVRPYLREFLSDARVIDIPAPLRWLLLNLFILPTRPAQSAAAYAKVWMPEGSPLLVHSRAFTAKLARTLGDDFVVDVAMRYGTPSITSVLENLLREPLKELVVVPLYPQYASSSTGTAVEVVLRDLAKRWNIPPLRILPAFHDDPGYLQAMTENAAPRLAAFRPDHVLFSYHGLPERQIRKSECVPGSCLTADDSCCATLGARNAFCYRAQCYATTRALTARLGLDPAQVSTSFQSRLGRTPWIKPYTDEVLVHLARAGVKRLAVFSPSFVADCLETLEEMSIRGLETFVEAGG